jgi:hypothetical protein
MNEGKVTLKDFFKDIVRLSFIGDVRTYLKAERSDKIDNIVLGAFEEYVKLYKPFFEKYNIVIEHEHIILSQRVNEEVYNNIPLSFLENVKINAKLYLSQKEFKDRFINNFSSNNRRLILENYIKKINLKYSIYALITGLYSSNISKIVIVKINISSLMYLRNIKKV